ncbi:MAG TPA: hypothetical protein VFG69_06310 [Nannocystaceae bacterium]|nr:hypothetical protein [Nannocystaceae bacterium]
MTHRRSLALHVLSFATIVGCADGSAGSGESTGSGADEGAPSTTPGSTSTAASDAATGGGDGPSSQTGDDADESDTSAGDDTGGQPFPPNPALADLASETALDLGPFTCEGVPGEDESLCKRATDYSGFVYDPHRHQMLLFGGGHSTTMTDAIHAFDLGDTLTWSGLYSPTPCDQMSVANLDADNGAWTMGPGPYPRPVSTHTYDMLAVPPTLDEFIVISRNFTGGYCNPVGNDIGGRIAHFDRAAQTWSFSPDADGSTYDLAVNIPGSEPDPISGGIVLFGGGGLAIYDPMARVYTQHVDTYNGEYGNLGDLDGIGYANHMVYFPPDDRFYLFTRDGAGTVFALKLDRDAPEQSVAERLVTTGTPPPGAEAGLDYDATNDIIGGAVLDSTFYAFDPETLEWSAHPMNGGAPGNVAFHALAYDPVDNVFVFVTDADSGQRTWAYRLAS